MKKVFALIVAFSMIFSITSVVFAQDASSTLQGLPQQANIETILTIGIGNGEQQVGYTPKIEGVANDGPASFTLDQNNNIYVLDTLNKKVMMYKDGQWQKNIEIYFTSYARDIKYHNNALYILDESSSVYKLDTDGNILAIYSLPNGLEAYQVDKLGINNDRIVAQSNNLEYDIETGVQSLGYKVTGKKLHVSFKDNKNVELVNSADKTRHSIITFAEKSGGLNILGSDNYGNTYVAVEDEVPDSPLVLLEYTIRMLDSKGKQVGFARIPLEDYYNFPQRFVNVTANGQIYIMALKENSIEIDRVTLGQSYESKMPMLKEKARQAKVKAEKKVKSKDVIMTYIPDIPTRTDVYYEANDQINLSWTYYSSNSYAPTGTSRPDYLASITSFPSSQVGVPYCWGGFDGTTTHSSSSWTNFSDAMYKGYFAGNVTCTGGWKSGTAGFDCSGFVSAAYFFSQKYSTNGLYSMQTDIAYDSVANMDIFNDPGSHVLFFNSWNADRTSVNSKESTTSGNDKTKNYTRTRSYLSTNGYIAGTMW